MRFGAPSPGLYSFGLVLSALVIGPSACATAPPSPQLMARLAARAPLKKGQIGLRWLGTAGFELRTTEGTLLFDPYLSRFGVSALAFGRMVSDEALLTKSLPEADLILIGHSHFDHLLDAPAIARRTGGHVLGSPTTCRLAEALLLERSQCHVPAAGRPFLRSGFSVTPILSRHGLAPVIGVPLPGNLTSIPRWTHPHAVQMPMGGAVIWVVRTEGLTIVHLSSANLPPTRSILRRLVPEGADLVLASIAIREGTQGYARALIRELRPKLIIPHHHDPLIGPLAEPFPERSEEDLRTFMIEAAGARVEAPVLLKERILSAADF